MHRLVTVHHQCQYQVAEQLHQRPVGKSKAGALGTSLAVEYGEIAVAGVEDQTPTIDAHYRVKQQRTASQASGECQTIVVATA